MTAKGVWVLTTNIMRVRYFLCMFMKMYYYISAARKNIRQRSPLGVSSVWCQNRNSKRNIQNPPGGNEVLHYSNRWVKNGSCLIFLVVNCAAYLFFFLSGLMCRYMSYVMTPQWDQDYWRELQRLEGFFATKFRWNMIFLFCLFVDSVLGHWNPMR